MCRTCHRSFTRRVNLARHMAQHPTLLPSQPQQSFTQVTLFELLDTIDLEDMPLPQAPEHGQEPGASS